MRKYYLIISAWIICFCYIQAQSRMKFIVNHEGKLFAIPTYTDFKIEVPKIEYKSYTSVSEQNRRMLEKFTSSFKEYTSDIDVEYVFMDDYFIPEADRPMNMNALSAAYRPLFNPYTQMLRNINQMALDYDETFTKSIGRNSAFIVNGVQETWPGLGGTNIVNMGFSQSVGKVSLTAGSFAGRYYTPYTNQPQHWGGINIMAHYEANDWLSLNAWGSQSFYGPNKAAPFLQMNPLLNRTNVGGSMNFKVSDDFRFGIGVNFQHNHMSNGF